MIGLLGINAIIRERSLTTTPGAFVTDVGPRLTSYEHTITATGGFESCTLAFPVRDVDEASAWGDRLLCPVDCYGPDMDHIWGGFIAGAELRVGGRTRSLSLDAVANRVRARYSRPLGDPGATAAASNAASVALYGVHDAVLSLGTLNLQGATALRDSWLARYALPRAQPQTSVRTGGDTEPPTVVLTCAGWYTTLDWVTLERADTSTEASTLQIASLIAAAAPGIGAINTLLSASLAPGSATDGETTTRKIEADTTYRAAIEQRLGLGSTAGQRYAWGVETERRELAVRTWAGATPTTIGYRVRFADADVASGGGGGVALWGVRPDAMVEDSDWVVAGPPSDAVETPATFYLERVAFRAGDGGMELTLEPEASSGLDARIARASS